MLRDPALPCARAGWWESAAEHGPFVRSTCEEIVRAVRDHRAGKVNDVVPHPVAQGGLP